MPFDAAAPTTFASLAEAVQHLGITPIPTDDLDRHKQAEVAKHPGSWVYHHRRTIRRWIRRAISFGLPMAAAAAPLVILMPEFGIASFLAIPVVLAGILCHFGGIRLQHSKRVRITGPAHWFETTWRHLPDNVPDGIAQMAATLLARVPGSYLRFGELLQHSEVLDPYLVVVSNCNTERVVLGIWDDHGVIQQAAITG